VIPAGVPKGRYAVQYVDMSTNGVAMAGVAALAIRPVAIRKRFISISPR
jgi:hypothetical protein